MDMPLVTLVQYSSEFCVSLQSLYMQYLAEKLKRKIQPCFSHFQTVVANFTITVQNDLLQQCECTHLYRELSQSFPWLYMSSQFQHWPTIVSVMFTIVLCFAHSWGSNGTVSGAMDRCSAANSHSRYSW